jgi:coniferyl-aldehyde dehydrogenase
MAEAIKRANDTAYGLAAGIVTKDLDKANAASRSIRAGSFGSIVIWHLIRTVQ